MSEPGKVIGKEKSIEDINDQYIRLASRIEQQANLAAMRGDLKRERELDTRRERIFNIRKRYVNNIRSSQIAKRATEGLNDYDRELYMGPFGAVNNLQVPSSQYMRNNRRK